MGRSNGLAMPPGTDPVQLGRYLNVPTMSS